MAFCKNCGAEVGSNEFRCNNCGNELRGSSNPAVNDTGGFGWGLLGFCLPLVGLILFLVWNKEKPNTAKACITGAAIGFILGIIGTILNGAILAGM